MKYCENDGPAPEEENDTVGIIQKYVCWPRGKNWSQFLLTSSIMGQHNNMIELIIGVGTIGKLITYNLLEIFLINQRWM